MPLKYHHKKLIKTKPIEHFYLIMSLTCFTLFLFFLVLFSLTLKNEPFIFAQELRVFILFPFWFSFLYLLISMVFLWLSFEYYSLFPKLKIPFWALLYQGPYWVFTNSKIGNELKKISTLIIITFTTMGFTPFLTLPGIPIEFFLIFFFLSLIFIALTFLELYFFFKNFSRKDFV